jgi:O-antigen/teichoic acid export membrane protein
MSNALPAEAPLSGAGVSPPIEPAEADLSELTQRRLRRGGALYGFSQFAGMLLGFLSGIVLVRVAEQPAVASYMLLLQAVMAVGLALQLGLGPAALRFVPICRGEGGERATALLRRRLFGIQVTLWLIAVPLLALAWPAIAWRLDAPELERATPYLVSAALLTSFGHLMDSYLRAFRMYSAAAPISQLLPRGLVLGGFLTLWLGGLNGVSWDVLIAVYLTSLLVTALGYAVALRATTAAETSEPRTASVPPGVREILGTSTAMGLRSAASILFVSSSLWILSWARPHAEVAVYGVAATLLQILGAIPSIANFVLPQEFALLHADGRRPEMERLARTAATLVAILSAFSIAGLLLVGRPLIRIAYGSEYVGAWGILLILALGTFWDSASGGAGFVLQMTGHHKRLLLLTVGGALVNVALSLALAPIWGGYGIALATSVTLIAINMAMVRSVRRLLGVRTFVFTRPSQWMEALRLLRGGMGRPGE